MMMTKQKSTLNERLNIGDEVRELKLGATFNPKNTSTAFHTIKYDFKPASVDTSRMATVDVGSNNQVTVTVPNLESSGVPHTVYKGNHKKYTKECLIIFDKETGAITIEKLNHNIQVKKTRSEMSNKPSLMPATNAPSAFPNGSGPGPGSGSGSLPVPSSGPRPTPENSTMRITSKTKVSTGSRRNNIIDYKPRNSPMQQSSPSRPVASHRSPQSAPAWHANNAQQTLPSIPMLLDDDDFGLGAAMHNGGQANISGSSTGSSVGQPDYASSHGHMGKQRQAPLQNHAKRQQLTQRSSPPMQHLQQQQRHEQQQQQHHQQQQQHQQQQNYGRGNSNSNNYAQQQQLQQQRPSFSNHNSNSMPLDLDSPSHHDLSSQSVAQAAAALEQEMASSSSSDSDSSDSDSGSDSDDSSVQDQPQSQHHQHQMQHQQHHNQHHQQQHLNQLPNLGLGSISPAYNNHHQQQQSHHHHQQQQQQQQHQQQMQQSGIYASNNGFPNDLLQNDLQLSSNSSDDDD
ncbi:ell-associated factor Eaf [Drosophila albomicans]|uniref:Ell-associated factor Eaf n=1 Tax=Drosophila albomicans TaxID=7291 RepID=A0A6P8X8Q7_DROAB|nr:ell-associated factor Eaf [Drosophila albomicans]XP_034107670.1 ell-associated factor Eaf [Drosophila albomicans]